MAKIDFKKQFKELYNPPRDGFSVVDVQPMAFLMADGAGDPETAPAFKNGVEALFGAAYTLKFMLKKIDPDLDYVVPPLEGLWWADDMSSFMEGDKEKWKWTLMIMQPESVTGELFQEALRQLEKKKKLPPEPVVRLEEFHEGLSVQTLHIGPYSEEAPTIQRMHSFIAEKGYQLRARHHEIYLGDPRRTSPEKLRTILRQPVL